MGSYHSARKAETRAYAGMLPILIQPSELSNEIDRGVDPISNPIDVCDWCRVSVSDFKLETPSIEAVTKLFHFKGDAMKKLSIPLTVTAAACVCLSTLIFTPKLVSGRAINNVASVPDKKYSQLASKYLEGCADRESSRPSNEKLKECLVIARELRDKFDAFVQGLTSASDKLKREDKWTKELDDKFERDALKDGVRADLVNEVKQKGGFREFYQKSFTVIKGSRADLDAEVRALEKELQGNASAGRQNVLQFSFTSTSPNHFFINKTLYMAIIYIGGAICYVAGCL